MTTVALAELSPTLGKMLDASGGLFSQNNLNVLHALMMEHRPKRTLEIGMGSAGSTLTICASHQRLGRSPDRQHIAIDPFQRTSKPSGLDAIERAGLSAFLDHRETFSATALPQLLEKEARFGLIYVDGSHIVEDVFIDAYYGVRLLEPNGVIAFDDCSDRHVAKVLRFIRTNMPGLQELNINRGRRNELVYLTARRLCKVQMTAFKLIGEAVRPYDAKFAEF
jgi:predicted O-methyltransferase YrrM